ncbi:MAG: SRPBCC family protein [Thermoflavifilum sp.]|nr:SRPBCC family protein [Thermoflavifilum sp.]
MPHSLTIIVTATVHAPVDKVWKYYTKPDHIVHWNYAVDEWHCPWAKNDLKIGGKFTYRMEAKDGSSGFDFEGIYDEIIHHQKITYTMPNGRQAITTFEEINGKTIVTIAFDAETINPAEMQKAGWQAILDHFKEYTETH